MSRKPPPRYRPDRWDYELGWRWYADACEEQALADADEKFGPLASGFTGCDGDGDPRGTVHGQYTEGPGSLFYCGVSRSGEIVDGRAQIHVGHFKRHPHPLGSVAAWWNAREAE